MEGSEGVPMANNTPVAVAPKISAPESTGGFGEDIGKFGDKVGGPDVEADVQFDQPRQDKSVADKLFDSAKSDGADIALEKFANDGFEEEDEGSAKTDENELQDELHGNEETIESNPLEQKVTELESRVSELLSKNAELAERLEKTQEQLDMILRTRYELAQFLKVLQKLIEEEEDEKKKKSLWEILIALMGLLLQELVDPETEREESSGNKKPVEKAA